MALYYNRKRTEELVLSKGDKVYLLRQKQNATLNISQIKTKRPSDKLDFKKLCVFKIDKVISKTNYRLSLSRTMKIHPVFYIFFIGTSTERRSAGNKFGIRKERRRIRS